MKYQRFIVSYLYLSLLEVAVISCRRTILLVGRTNTGVLVLIQLHLAHEPIVAIGIRLQDASKQPAAAGSFVVKD